MALMKCSECGKDVSDKAGACPNCGAPVATAAEADPWKEIDIDLSLYKFYLELLLKGATVVLALTGGVASYYLAHPEAPLLKFALILPLLINLGFAAICAFGYKPARTLARDHEEMCRQHEIKNPYDLSTLQCLLLLFVVTYLGIAIGLGVLLCISSPV